MDNFEPSVMRIGAGKSKRIIACGGLGYGWRVVTPQIKVRQVSLVLANFLVRRRSKLSGNAASALLILDICNPSVGAKIASLARMKQR
jgi:hypothetical protein